MIESQELPNLMNVEASTHVLPPGLGFSRDRNNLKDALHFLRVLINRGPSSESSLSHNGIPSFLESRLNWLLLKTSPLVEDLRPSRRTAQSTYYHSYTPLDGLGITNSGGSPE